MKKILLAFLILIFSMQLCLAEGENSIKPVNATNPNNAETPVNTTNIETPEAEEDIDSYFTNEESEQEVPQQVVEQNNEQDSEQTVELHGYLQYNDQEPQQEAIQLEPVETAHVNFSEPKKIGAKSLISGTKKPTFHPIQDELESASKFATQEYNIKPVSTSYVQKVGHVSFGTMYDSSLDSASVNYSTGVFTKIEGKYFAIKTAFSKSTNSNYNAYNDTIYFAPELKLTKRLSFLDIMQTDVYQINKKNELVLRYTPHFKKHEDDVQLEFGAGQSFYQDNYVNSSVRFSTRFKL